jgi:hypothetical protein
LDGIAIEVEDNVGDFGVVQHAREIATVQSIAHDNDVVFDPEVPTLGWHEMGRRPFW